MLFAHLDSVTVSARGLQRAYNDMPLEFHMERYSTAPSTVLKMAGDNEWAFFTDLQNPCGRLEDPKNGKIICKLKQGTAYCRVKCGRGYMYENTKKRTQWCRNGYWYPRKTPQCVAGIAISQFVSQFANI